MRAVERGIPLPLGAISNRRSLIYVENLVDAVWESLRNPAAAGRTFVLSDGAPLSTPELIRRIARQMNRPARLWSVPPGLLRFSCAVLGMASAADRLLGSLEVDDRGIRDALGWKAPCALDESLARTVKGFRR
jgi:nucleoside-diphosphate-sugar epimerase